MIVTLTGTSGTGKTTIAQALYRRLPHAAPLQSYTTRPKRSTDIPGDYSFVSEEEFERMKNDGKFLWTASVGRTQYGTREQDLRDALNDTHQISVMILVPERVPNVHAFAASIGKADQVKSFLVQSPNEVILRKRMHERGEPDEMIEERIRATGDYEQKAKTLPVPFISIEDRNLLEDKIKAVIELLT